MTCTAASHQGAIKEPAASLFRTCEAHPVSRYTAVWKSHGLKPLKFFVIPSSKTESGKDVAEGHLNRKDPWKAAFVSRPSFS